MIDYDLQMLTPKRDLIKSFTLKNEGIKPRQLAERTKTFDFNINKDFKVEEDESLGSSVFKESSSKSDVPKLRKHDKSENPFIDDE
jgi:hypothetical protein